MRSYTELEKTLASFPSCYPANRGVEKGKAVAFSPRTCKERLGQLSLLSWVKRRSHTSPQEFEGNLQEDKPFLVVQTAHGAGAKPYKFLLRRLGPAFGKRCFFLSRKVVQHWKGCSERPQKPVVL